MLEKEELLKAVNWNYAEWYAFGKDVDGVYLSSIEKQFMSFYSFSKINNSETKIEMSEFFIGFYEGFLFSQCLCYTDIRKEIRKIKEENLKGFLVALIEKSLYIASLF